MQTPVLLRAATPDYDEGLVFARYMDQAAEGFFRFLLGRRAESVMATAFLKPRHALSYEHVTFAERDGELVGMTSAYTGIQLRGFDKRPLEQVADRPVWRLRCLRVVLTPVFRILDTVADEELYLQGIAVDPRLRGEGIGSFMLDHIEQVARASGSSRLCLDVASGNAGGRRLYARRGFVETTQWPAIGFVPPLFIRMTKEL